MNDVLKRIYEGGLPKGYYTLGDGHIHKVPTTGYSKWYKRGDYKFRFNNATQQIEAYYMDGLFDSMGLSFMNWIENPDYWVDYYMKELEDTAEYENIYEGGLPKGYYTLGDGHIHKVPTTGYSKWYKRGDYKFRFNNATQQIEAYYMDGLFDSMGLSFMNWIENPDYWVDYYMKELEDTAEYENIYGESTELREDQSYVIAYREGGQDKYSSVQAQSSSDALRIFNALIDKSGRHVNNAHIAIEDVDLSEETGLPPLQTWKVIRKFDDDEVELATLKARNKDEANATMLMALLDAGYYEGEVSPEISNGSIYVVKECNDLNEDADKKLFKVEYHYHYEDEIDEYPYARSATYIDWRLVLADSSEDAVDKVMSHITEIANETPGIVGDPYDFAVVNVWDSLESYKKAYPYSNAKILS